MTSSPPTNATAAPSPEIYGFEWFPWLTEGLLLLVVGAMGLVGNCCSIVIFARYLNRANSDFQRCFLKLSCVSYGYGVVDLASAKVL